MSLDRRRPSPLTVLACLGPIFLLGVVLPGQNGDKKGEEQADVPARWDVPDAPVVAPADAVATLTVPEGFRVELVAAEPLIEDPVAIEFGPDGRLWVVEMRGFMPNVEGTDEQKPVGRVSVLSDADGDGRMDTSVVFADQLVLPRGLAIHRDGVLVIEPPRLLFLRDTDGDGKADQREVVLEDGFANGLDNPEHAGNSPLWGLDNRLHLANFGKMLVRDANAPAGLRAEPDMVRGQWGLSQDDIGRHFYDYNSDYLRADHYPSHYAIRNPHLGRAGGVNVRLDRDQTVFPGRINPGANRGYRKGTLRDDGRLHRFTSACAPVVYRGDLLTECRGDVFVAEPVGNLVRRAHRTTDEHGRMSAKNAYQSSEFLTSTDERFRPVNAQNGPDGALYIVDLYRGIIQHRIFMTTFLRKQVLARGLDRPIGCGRIYRIVPKSASRDIPPAAATLDSRGLVARLGDDNGFQRDVAQRLLVERKDRSIAAALRRVQKRSDNAIHRLHALWTLDGIGALRRGGVRRALKDGDAAVRAAGVRLAEARFAAEAGAELFDAVVGLGDDPDAGVRRQVIATLGARRDAAGRAALRAVFSRHAEDPWLASLVVSGLHRQELEFLRSVLADSQFATASKGRTALLQSLSRCVIRERKGARVAQLIDAIGTESVGWRKVAMLRGAVAGLPRGKQRAGWLRLDAPPAQWADLNGVTDKEVAKWCVELGKALSFASAEPARVVTELTAVEKQRFQTGKALYAICMACHQANGRGLPGLAPPLAESEWVAGSDRTLARIVLHGLVGPVQVQGKEWNLVMPGQPAFTDDHIASILTYVRRSFGNQSAPVDPKTVADVRAQESERGAKPWTAGELKQRK